MKRYFATFLRHPWLYLLPVVLVLAGSAALANRAVRNATPYSAEATVAVNLDPTRPRGLGEEPPAQQYAQLLGELMETDGFLVSVLQQTSLATPLNSIADPTELLHDVRSQWKQAAAGPNTMRVSYQCTQPSVCTEVVATALATFRDQVSEARLARKTAAVQFYQQQLQAAEERLRILPLTDPGRDTARQTYETLLTRMVDAGLEESLETQARQDNFRILAAPRTVGPNSPVKEAALPLALGLLVGLSLAVGAIVLATWLDTTLRTPDDVATRLNLATVASVPVGGIGSGDPPSHHGLRRLLRAGTRLAFGSRPASYSQSSTYREDRVRG